MSIAASFPSFEAFYGVDLQSGNTPLTTTALSKFAGKTVEIAGRAYYCDGSKLLPGSKGDHLQSFSAGEWPGVAAFGAGQAIVDGRPIYIGASKEYLGALRNPRLVKNLFAYTNRFPDASVFGTGTKVQSLVSTDHGVTNGLVTMSTGTAGRSFVTQSFALTAGQWYAMGFEVVSMDIGDGADCGQSLVGGVIIDRGNVSIIGANIVAGGIGRYVATFMSVLGGAMTFRMGVGLGGNGANKTLTIKNLFIEAIAPEDGFRPSEFVYPSYSAAFDYQNPCSVINNKVSESATKNYFGTKPYSNIIALGDSRSDEDSNIPGELLALTLADKSGNVHWHAAGGWGTLQQIGPVSEFGATYNIDTVLNGSCLRRTTSTAGAEQVYSNQGMSYDTLLIADFGYNDANVLSNQAIMSNIRLLINKALSKGMRVILTDNNPFSAFATWAAKGALVKSLNVDLMNEASGNGYLWVSIYDKLGDSTSADKLSDGLGTTPDYSQDDLHLNQAGSQAVAVLIKAERDRNR